MFCTILGPPRSKKNSMVAMCIGGKPRLLQSKLYRDYEKDALKQLMAWGNLYIPGPVQVICRYFVPDKRRRDLTNLLAATHDILQKSGIIEDDSLIVSVDCSRIVGVDRKNPRVEIEITRWINLP
jgi:Holliday junction resolvase RusA-like endonuclease